MKVNTMPVLPESQDMKDWLVKVRRDFHQHPERGFEEVRTAGIVNDFLRELGIETQTGVATTGVVGLINGELPGKTLALRADMDALEVEEQTGASYASKTPGLMHACGHDAHTTILMGTAKILQSNKHKLKGNVKLLFQPAEESVRTDDYVGGGAKPMVEAGVMTGVDAVAGLHVFPQYLVGRIQMWKDHATASADEFHLKILGKGGHAALPHKARDAIVLAAQAISAIQTIASRQIDPVKPVVVTIGTIQGGTRHNVICDEVSMSGTVRTLEKSVRDLFPDILEHTITGAIGSSDGKLDLVYEKMYPVGRNDPKMRDIAFNVAETIVGKENVEWIPPKMGGEDFWYFAEKAPGVFISVGAGNPKKGIVEVNHHPKFEIDEDCLPIGVSLLSQLALTWQN
ncbi:MAG: M20 metallopeptidase family protein [Candidatus Ranarchaeia archaeon]|jgi:amidohydrolase